MAEFMPPVSELGGWMDDEEGLRAAWLELRRLVGRALARRWLTLGLTLAAAAAWVGLGAWQGQRYVSRVVFRVDEGGGNVERTSIGRLRRFLREEVLTNEGLLDLMRRHRISVAEVQSHPLDAVEWMRDEEVDVQIWRDPFAGSVEDHSARLALGFSHRDPKVAYDFVGDLAELVAERTENGAIVRAEMEAARLDRRVEESRQALARPRAEIARRELALSRAAASERGKRIVELEELRAGVRALESRLAEAERARDDARLRVQAERKKQVMRFVVVEPPRAAMRDPEKWLHLAGSGLMAFALLLPLMCIAVGAEDQRVFDASDLRRLGLEPLGHVRRFPGDQVGSLDERMKRMMYTEDE
jgi:hypothetical protein